VTDLRFLGVGHRPAEDTTGDLGTATGTYGIDGPDLCRDACPLAGTEHTEDQCVAEVGEQQPPCPTCGWTWTHADGCPERKGEVTPCR